jgi:myosin heavy subunit
VELTDSKTKIKAPIQNALKLTYGPTDVPDMVDLEELNEPELLFNIKRRYTNDMVFTYCGTTDYT